MVLSVGPVDDVGVGLRTLPLKIPWTAFTEGVVCLPLVPLADQWLRSFERDGAGRSVLRHAVDSQRPGMWAAAALYQLWPFRV